MTEDRLTQRIEQFEQLCRDDAGNDMAHFSLAGAYAQAERHDDAARSYVKAIELNEGLSKAYQLAGQAYMNAGHENEAVDILRRGYVIAAGRGDLMPKNAMGELLGKLSAEVPDIEVKKTEAPASAGGFTDKVTGAAGSKMAHPPFRGPIGQWYQENVTQERFDEWIGMGTKVINELKLDLSNDEHDAVYDATMRGYLGLDDETYRRLTDGQEPPQPGAEYRDVINTILGREGDLEQFQGELGEKL